MTNDKPLTPILQWLSREQADITSKQISEITGITPQTLSKVRQGKQDLSSDLLWRVMEAIAYLRPNSDCARVISLIRGKNFSKEKFSLFDAIAAADDSELEKAMLQIVARMFPKSCKKNDVSADADRVKSPIFFRSGYEI